MPLTLNGSGGITYPDGTVNATRSVSAAGDTMTGLLTVPSFSVTNGNTTLGTGNVGIGTSSPTARLHVAGNVAVADDSTVQDTTPYATFGVTRSSAVAGIASYMALTRGGQYVYALGISDTNAFIIGPPDANKKITTTRLSIDVSGRVTLPGQPSFSASGAAELTVAEGAIVPFATTITNVGGHYNSSNATFTAPVAGRYYFSFSIYKFANRLGTFCFAKNGIEYGPNAPVLGYGGSTSPEMTVGVDAIITLAANDTISVRCRIGTGTSHAYLPHSIFNGYLLG